MSAAVIPIARRARTHPAHATWSLLELARPGAAPLPLGILLVEDESGCLTIRLRDLSGMENLEEQEIDILDSLEGDLQAKAREAGGKALLDSLEDSLSGFLRITDRTVIAFSGDPEKTADWLFDQHVDCSVRPFVTHLPLYSLRAAATKFGEGMNTEQEGWMRVAGGLPGLSALKENMFVARVVGRSMEPLIPDGSLCVFRTGVTGTRQGRRLLIELFGETDFDARYTVKHYTSVKSFDPDTGWEHSRIRLEPLNREFSPFDLGPEDFRVIGEFVAVLE